MNIIIKKSTRKDKRFMVIIEGKKIHFGSIKHENFTLHKDEARKQRYITRHQKRENWTKSGIRTAGFWSRWILWNLPSLRRSIKDTEKRFNIKIKFLR